MGTPKHSVAGVLGSPTMRKCAIIGIHGVTPFGVGDSVNALVSAEAGRAPDKSGE